MFDHVLVPLDGSSLAECVLPHAVALAQAFGAEATVLQVLKSPSAADVQAQPLDPLDWEIRKVEARAYLDRIDSRLQKVGFQTEGVLLEGQPAQRIIEFVNEHDIDLIVLCTHGRSGLSGWNVSSVVQKVLLRAHVSILLVRAYQPTTDELGDFQYRRLLLPLDGSQRAECILSPASTLATSHGAQLLLTHVIQKPELPRRSPLTEEETELVDRLVECNREEAIGYLDHLQGQLSLDVQTHLRISDDVPLCLHELAEEEAVDLVVLSAHGYSGRARWPYGSVATSFINYSALPLLIVQDLPPEEVAPMLAEVAIREYQGH